MKPLPLCAACALIAAAATPAAAFDLRVEVLNPRSSTGFVAGAVYDSDAGWLKTDQAVQVARTDSAEKSVLVYRDLPAGRYAISVFHDENANGKLDANLMGMPTERYGFSRDARGRMGPPAFGDAALELGADTTITIHLQ